MDVRTKEDCFQVCPLQCPLGFLRCVVRISHCFGVFMIGGSFLYGVGLLNK